MGGGGGGGGGDGAKIRGEGICMNKLLEGGYQFFSRKWGGGCN